MKTITKIQCAGLHRLFNPDSIEETEIFFYRVISKALVALLIIFILMLAGIKIFAQTPGFGFNDLNYSNVNARILTGGDMFWDLINAKFEVPKGGGKNTIFAGSLWIGGLDPSNNLHVAAQTYRQTGNDYWPGPIDINGNPSVSSQWDTVWKVNKSTVDYHIQHWSDVGYVVPPELSNWPANGTAPFSPVLAPFVDLNANFTYEPALGEFPFIYGDQATYNIFNDVANFHGETNGMPLGIEVHQMSYEINSVVDSFLTNSVFMRYEVGNRSDTSYHDVYLGLWTDFDIGWYADDYVGTDVGRSMYYGYNGDNNDDSLNGGYGLNPPAQGVLFLSHPLTHSQYYNNDFSVSGNPTAPDDYYNYMKSVWKDSLPATHTCTGRDAGPLANFMFPGDLQGGSTDPNFTDDLNEFTCGNAPGDRRMLGSIGPLDLPADSFFVVDVAFVYARGDSGAISSVFALQTAADSIINRYAGGSLVAVQNPVALRPVTALAVYPNPASEKVMLVFDNDKNEKFALEILDITGKIVLNRENISGNHALINISNLPPGIFTILLQSSTKFVTGKLVVK